MTLGALRERLGRVLLFVLVVLLAPILIPVGIVVLAVIAFRTLKSSNFDPIGFKFCDDEPAKPVVDERLKNVFPGTMPDSNRLRGVVYRFQPKAHVYDGPKAWKMFFDGPWKWAGKYRYAGTGLNPGHFFAFYPESARHEILHYSEDLSPYELLSLEGEIDNVLDLTSLHTIGNIWHDVQEQEEQRPTLDWGKNKTWGALIAELITEDTGGGPITDRIGLLAYQKGYSGLVFHSARTVDPEHRENMETVMRLSEGIVEDYILNVMRKHVKRQCLVIFSGSTVLRSTRRYKVGTGDWQDNPYFGLTQQEVDDRLADDAEYQHLRKISVPHNVVFGGQSPASLPG